MTHLWLRAEQRANEQRVPLTPKGAQHLRNMGMNIMVEASDKRCFSTDDYAKAGCQITDHASWLGAPRDAFILGLKELPQTKDALVHRHIMFGHAFKGQHAGQALLNRFKAGGGLLLDLEYLVDTKNRRVAAFGYWAGYAGAAVALKCWAAQKHGQICQGVKAYPNNQALLNDLRNTLSGVKVAPPTGLVIGALGRVGTGVSDLCDELGLKITKWDLDDTAGRAEFPQILQHSILFNCILAQPGAPVFLDKTSVAQPRLLRVVADIACDPDSDYNPLPIYTQATDWDEPAQRIAKAPVLDVMAIDNLPSLVPRESSEDFAQQLLPYLEQLLAEDSDENSVWRRAEKTYRRHIAQL